MKLDVDHVVSCSQPITIPFAMDFKGVNENKYAFAVYSNDLEVAANVPDLLRRKVQMMSVSMADAVAIGQMIDVSVLVAIGDDAVVLEDADDARDDGTADRQPSEGGMSPRSPQNAHAAWSSGCLANHQPAWESADWWKKRQALWGSSTAPRRWNR